MKRRTLWMLLSVPLAALLLLAAAAVWLLTTESGLRRALVVLEGLDRVTIRVDGARGRLIGPLQADTVLIEHPRATIRLRSLEADYEPSELLAGRIAAERIRVAGIDIQVHPRTEPPRGAPAFMPRWLTAVADDLQVEEARITSPQGNVLLLRGVGGSARVSRRSIRFRDVKGDAGNWSAAGASGSLAAREPLALDGNTTFTLTRAREVTGQARFGGDLGRLLVDARFDSPARAQASVTVTDLVAALRWSATGELEELDLRRWLDEPPLGPLRGSFTASGDIRSYRANGQLHGDGLPERGVDFDAALGYADGVLLLPEVLLAVPGTSMSALAAGEITLGDEPRLGLSTQWTDFRWPLAGKALLESPSGQLGLSGWRAFAFQTSGRYVVPGLPPAEGSARGQLTATQLLVEESSFATLGGRIEAAGMVTRDEPRAWTLSGQARDVDPAALREQLDGRLSFGFSASGVGVASDARWAGAVTGLSGTFRGQRASGTGLVRRRPALTEFEQVALDLGPARLRLNGSVGERLSLDGTLVARDLSGFLPELAGSVDARLAVRGSRVDVSVTGRDMAWHEHRATVLSADAYVDLDDREPSWLRLRTAGLRVAGQDLSHARLSLDGLAGDHRVEFQVGVGADALDMLGRASWAGGRYELEALRIVAAGPRTPPYQLESPARLAATRDAASLSSACFVDGARRVCAEGGWNRGRAWTFRIYTRAFPLEALDLKVPGKPRYSGLLSVDARFAGEPGQPWTAELRAEVTQALLEYQAPSGRPQSVALGRTLLTLDSDRHRHRLGLRLAEAAEADLAAELVVERVKDLPLAQLPLSGQVRGATQQLDLLPLLVEDIDQASGALAVDLALAGRLGEPQLRGRVRLERGSLDFYQANLRLRDIDATLALDENRLDLTAAARAGDGSLAIDGRLGWVERRIGGRLRMQGERLLLVDVPEARLLASPDLTFELDGRRITVSGTVTVPEGRIDPAEIAGATFASGDERILRRDVEEQDGPAGFEAWADLRLVLGERVEIDAYGLSGRVTGSVRARSRPGEAAVASGELEVEDGRYRAYTRELDVERGRLLFTGGPVTDPGVDLRASRRLPGYKVGVIVRGLLRRPQLSLFSEPALPQTQIASLLIVGRTLDSLQGGDRDSVESGRATLVAQGSALVAGQLGRYVGLDEVGVAQDSDDGTALVLGKYLSPRLYVSYGISLVDEINTLKLRYTIGDRWVLTAEHGRESAADVEYRIER